jgi:hypothetical protein
MSSIKISELQPVGYELFQDSESFLYELSDNEIAVGGARVATVVVAPAPNVDVNINVSIVAISVVTANGNTINANTISNVNTIG